VGFDAVSLGQRRFAEMLNNSQLTIQGHTVEDLKLQI